MSQKGSDYSVIAFNDTPRILNIADAGAFSSLAEIDLSIIKYNKKEGLPPLKKALAFKNYIDSEYTRLLIVRKYRRDNKEKIKFYELLGEKYQNILQEIIEKKLSGKKITNRDAASVLSQFSIYFDDERYKMILLLLNKYYNYFSEEEVDAILKHARKNSNDFVSFLDHSETNYPRIRNLVYSFEIYEKTLDLNDEELADFIKNRARIVQDNKELIIDLINGASNLDQNGTKEKGGFSRCRKK